jgi:hypothetical protein
MNNINLVIEVPKDIYDNFSTVVLQGRLEHLDIKVCKYSYGDDTKNFINLSKKTELRIYEFNELINILNVYLEKIENDIFTNNLYPFMEQDDKKTKKKYFHDIDIKYTIEQFKK